MADNVTTNGYTTATDEIAGVHYQRTKIGLGADGTAVDMVGGTGVDGTGVLRVTLATDVALPAGTNLMGKVGLDQTTPGTTNAVAVISGQDGIAGGTGVDGATVPRVTLATDVALPAGTNLMGKVGLDQTTPGTTNAVAVISGQDGIAGGTGVDGATVPRVTLATDVALPAGTNLMGKVGIDQTTPGTTNAVAVISGQDGIAGGTGVDGATVPRVTLATDVALPAGENQIGDVGKPGTVVDVTLSLDTSAYADGDLLADIQEIANAVRENGGRATLRSIQLLDEDDVGCAMDLIFSDSATSIGTENAAADISDANARNILGVISIAAADYVDLISNQIVTKEGLGLKLKAGAATTSLYIAAITRGGTPTYTASGVRLKLGLEWD